MPTPRRLAIVLVATAFTLGGGAAVRAEPIPDPVKAEAMEEINFFLARGEADACGPGCNEWIAADGKIDAGAAQRLRRLLAKLGRRRPPIFFHSPGGSVAGSLELGRLIHDQKFEVSVARTVPIGCDRDKPLEKSCEARKHSGQELESEFDPTIAMCNSGCVYAVAGGAVRLIPPGVKLGIHDVGLDPENALPHGALVGAGKRIAHARIQEYLHDVGIDEALFKAASAIPFESKKFLERDDLVRFGIDRREFAETAWQFADKPVPAISKRFFVRADSDKAQYVDATVSLSCVHGRYIGLAIARGRGVSETPGTGPRFLSISVKGQQYPLPSEIPSAEFDIRAAALPANAFDAVADDAAIGLLGTGLARQHDPAGRVTLNMEGFSMAYARLQKSCNGPTPNPTAATLPGKPVP